MLILTLLGISYLMLAQTERQIAENEVNALQALFVAEAGARMVVHWFDDPTATGFKVPTLSQVDRSLRWYDHDGDSVTPDVLGIAGDATKPIYRDGTDDLFEKPYRGANQWSFLGAESHAGTDEGPDLRIDSAGAHGAFLADLNDTLFPNYPSSHKSARITRIDVYGPPLIKIDGQAVRFGVATVKVIAGVFLRPGTAQETQVARRMTKVVLAELPYPGRSGPLISCKSLKLREGLSVHWGFVQAAGDIQIDSSDMDNGMDSGFPFDDSGAPGFPRDHISGSKLTSFLNVLDTSIEDPWFGVMAGGGFVTSSGSPLGSQAVQPFPFHCSDANDVSCTDSDHSNLFQNLGPSASPCPDMDYNLWKRTALSGIQHAYYYEYVSSGNFRLNGDPGSPLVTADLATSGRTGLFFFDTADGLPPTDSNGDGVFENLTDDVNFDNGWNSGGFIFLNAGTLSSRGLGNNPPLRSLRAPGEPFIESNGMEGWQNGEAFLRLVYPTSDPTNGDPTYTMIGTATAGRASLGPDLSGMVHMSGVLYNSGYWSAEGGGRFSGSIITRQGVVDRGRGAPEALDIWFDGCLQEGCWPAPPLRLPRVVPTGWENDM